MEENIKNCWCNACFRNIGSGNSDNRRQTALQSLAKRYRWFSNYALLLLVLMPLVLINLFWTHGYGQEWMRIAIVVFSMIYCATCSIMDRWLYRGICSIDIYEMSVAEVCSLAIYYRKRHLQFVVILIPMAVVLLGGIAWALSSNMYLIYGIITGALVGLILGTRQLYAFLDSYRSLTKE